MGRKLRDFFSLSKSVCFRHDRFFFWLFTSEYIEQSVNSLLPSDKSRNHRHTPESRLMSFRFQMQECDLKWMNKNGNVNPKVLADPRPQEKRDNLSENVVRCGTRDCVCDVFQILRIFAFLFKPTLHFLLFPTNKFSFIYWWWN